MWCPGLPSEAVAGCLRYVCHISIAKPDARQTRLEKCRRCRRQGRKESVASRQASNVSVYTSTMGFELSTRKDNLCYLCTVCFTTTSPSISVSARWYMCPPRSAPSLFLPHRVALSCHPPTAATFLPRLQYCEAEPFGLYGRTPEAFFTSKISSLSQNSPRPLCNFHC